MYSYDYECADYQDDSDVVDYVDQVNLSSARIIVSLAQAARKYLDADVAVLVKMKIESMFTRTLGLILKHEIENGSTFDTMISELCDYLDVTVAYAYQKTRDQYDSAISDAIDEKVKAAFSDAEERKELRALLDDIIALKDRVDYNRDCFGDIKYESYKV